MNKTAQLALPLVMAAQAQKHVTVNEALSKLDAFSQLRLASTRLSEPPSSAAPGQSYAVPEDAKGAWAGQAGTVATYVNGGWSFTWPLKGWEAWDEENDRWTRFDGLHWVAGALTCSASGASILTKTDEFVHYIAEATTNTTEYELPENSIVLGITGRVVESIQGNGLSSWRLGVIDSNDRYGANLGIDRNSYVLGLTSCPLTYYVPTPLLLTPDFGEFSSGILKLAVHYIRLFAPMEV